MTPRACLPGAGSTPETLALAGGIDWLGGLAGVTARALQVTFPEILFEDDLLVAFDKPSGLPVVPERRGGAGPSLMGLVRGRYGESTANVHRLDTEASGVVLCAKTKASLDFLSGQFQSKTVRKTHCALVGLASAGAGGVGRRLGPRRGGRPAGGIHGRPRHRPGRGRPGAHAGVPKARRPAERHGVPRPRVVRAASRGSSAGPSPGGRTRSASTSRPRARPVLNDRLYGEPSAVLLLSGLKRHYKGREEEKPLISRLALHAGHLGFVHPASREPMEVTAAAPAGVRDRAQVPAQIPAVAGAAP